MQSSVRAGVDGIDVSNHGCRQLNFARSGINNARGDPDELRAHGADLERFAVVVDGGPRRRTDVLKASRMAPRPSASNAQHSSAWRLMPEGVEQAFQVSQDEMVMHMRFMGTATVAELTPDMDH